MAGQTLPERDLTTDITGGYIPINMPKVGGGWKTKRAPASVFSSVNDSNLKLSNQTGNITVNVAANTYISKIRFKNVLNSPSIKIGLNPNGEEICELTPVTDWQPVSVESYYLTDTPIYITVSGGNVNIKIEQLINDL